MLRFGDAHLHLHAVQVSRMPPRLVLSRKLLMNPLKFLAFADLTGFHKLHAIPNSSPRTRFGGKRHGQNLSGLYFPALPP